MVDLSDIISGVYGDGPFGETPHQRFGVCYGAWVVAQHLIHPHDTFGIKLPDVINFHVSGVDCLSVDVVKRAILPDLHIFLGRIAYNIEYFVILGEK